MEEKGLNQHESVDESRRVLEFYSGIGGMRYSLMRAGVNARVVEAFDINDTANDVYQHNFCDRPYQGNIQNLSASDLDRYGAHAWLLSPPCQPYTRQGLQKGSEDARAASFITILELIQKMMKPPLMLFVENVVGFETSDTHKIMIDLLQRSDFVTQEFILSPIQFGVPYSRPRYFLLAKRKPSSFKNSRHTNQLLRTPKVLFGCENTMLDENDYLVESCDKTIQLCEPIGRFLEVKNSSRQSEGNPLSHTTNSPAHFEENNETSPHCIANGSDDGYIVYPNSKRCCCFTKSYYRYVKGTGSLLAIDQPKHDDKASSLKEQRLRYFTPREVANLHSFPEDFQFPESVSLRQRAMTNEPKQTILLGDGPHCTGSYALLGNSLSVAVVAPLLQYLFAEPA